jgi:hypothetical protein
MTFPPLRGYKSAPKPGVGDSMKTPRKVDLEVGPGRILRRFTELEARQILGDWITVYAKNAHGANIESFLWHAFSSGAFPSVCRQEAELRYAEQVASEVVVLSNDGGSALLTDSLPSTCNVSDYMVFPRNLAWSMAFTHEDGWLGPYFAKHQRYDSLVAENVKGSRDAKRKALEAERAKREGWR